MGAKEPHRSAKADSGGGFPFSTGGEGFGIHNCPRTSLPRLTTPAHWASGGSILHAVCGRAWSPWSHSIGHTAGGRVTVRWRRSRWPPPPLSSSAHRRRSWRRDREPESLLSQSCGRGTNAGYYRNTAGHRIENNWVLLGGMLFLEGANI